MKHELALLGGRRLRTTGWPDWPQTPADAQERLRSVLGTGRWTVRGYFTGSTSYDERFSKAFAAFNGVPYCTPVASGSAALMVALESLDIGFGDEVIVPVMTWMAPAIAVVRANAIPVFVDVCPDTLCISSEAVEAALTSRTRCILVVHHQCRVADLDRILDIARRFGLSVIEDASQAHGARWRGCRVGSLGDIGVFSMNQEKILAAGEGGAAITSNPTLNRRMEQLRADGSLFDSSRRVLYGYQSTEPGEVMGANLCLSEFQAAMALSGLEKLDALNAVRTANGEELDNRFKGSRWLAPLTKDERCDVPTYFKYALRVDRQGFAERPISVLCQAVSAELGLDVHPPDPPLHRNSLYCPLSKRRHRLGTTYEQALDTSQLRFPVAESAYESTFVFHHRALLAGSSALDDIVAAFEKVRRYADTLPMHVEGLPINKGGV